MKFQIFGPDFGLLADVPDNSFSTEATPPCLLLSSPSLIPDVYFFLEGPINGN